MAYSATIKLVVGDTRPLITTTLRDRNTAAPGETLRASDPTTWAPIDLTGATAKMFIREVGSSSTPAELTGTLTDAANGEVAFTIGASTFPSAGTYEGEIQVTFSDSGIQTVQDFIKFSVRDEIA